MININNISKFCHLLYPKQTDIYEKDAPSVQNDENFNRTKFFSVGSVLVTYLNCTSVHLG